MSKTTIRELTSQLLDLIEDGYGDYHVKLSVNYDHCDHIQELKDVWCPEHDCIVDWVLLQGGKE